jgi:hypothetical protein
MLLKHGKNPISQLYIVEIITGLFITMKNMLF